MRLALGLLLLACCGGAASPAVPPPASSASGAAHVEIDTSPEPSPFQAAAEAFKAQRAADEAEMATFVAQVLHPTLGPALATVQRAGAPTAAFGLKLDATEADVSKDFVVGKKACDGMIERFCPARSFVADLAPRTAAPVPYKLRGRFAGGKLYEIDAVVPLPAHEYTEAEKGLLLRAFEAEVRSALGPPTRLGYQSLEYGPALVVQYLGGPGPTVVVLGSQAARDKLSEENDKLTAAEQQVEEAKKRARLCTCAHVEVGDTFPRDDDRQRRGFSTPPDLSFQVLSVSPATCRARVRVRYRYGAPIGEMDKSCTEIPERFHERPCLGCANR